MKKHVGRKFVGFLSCHAPVDLPSLSWYHVMIAQVFPFTSLQTQTVAQIRLKLLQYVLFFPMETIELRNEAQIHSLRSFNNPFLFTRCNLGLRSAYFCQGTNDLQSLTYLSLTPKARSVPQLFCTGFRGSVSYFPYTLWWSFTQEFWLKVSSHS